MTTDASRSVLIEHLGYDDDAAALVIRQVNACTA
jgi:hypothetical protein